jgi:hypothetical protein
MKPNKRDLKAFVRYDGTGRVVPSSLILRKNKPKVGKWTEVQGYQCCNVDQTPVNVFLDGSLPFSYSSIEIGASNGNNYQYLRSYTDLPANDIFELAALFNTNLSNLGTFRVVDGNLLWTPSIQIAEFYQANHTTALYAYAFED